MAPHSRNRSRAAVAALVVALVTGSGAPAYAAPLVAPANIWCGPFENAGADRARVAWSDTSTGETGYRVQRSVDNGAFANHADIAANSTFYDDSGLDTAKVYRYRVRAVEGATEGPLSAVCRQASVFTTSAGNFRVYHRPYPVADCPPVALKTSCVPTNNGVDEYASRIGGVLEGTRTALSGIGFDDFAFFANGKPFPTDLIEQPWCGPGCATTDSWGNGRKGSIILAPSYMGPYDPANGFGDPSSVAIPLHEAFHQQQFTYGGLRDPDGAWVMEGQARAVQDKVCVGASAANCTSLDSVTNGIANYFAQVNGYLGLPDFSLTRSSYGAALFWTYLLERYGTITEEPHRGMDFMVEFWKQARASNTDTDTGIGNINRALTALGHSARFDDVFRDFVVANYAKDLTGPSVPAKYKYVDETQPPGKYNAVRLALDTPLAKTTQVGPTLDSVPAYATRYYQFTPSPAVGTIDVRVNQDSSHPIHYSLLLVKNGDLVQEIRGTGTDFAQAVPNAGYDRVVLVVAGLGNHVNYRYSVNATQPVLSIVDPLTNRTAQAGTAAAPRKVLVKASLLAANGDPVAGLDKSAFTVTIGTKAVPPGDVIASAFVQGQYWLLVQAPTQSADGLYDLTVAVSGLTASQPGAIRYGPPPRTDNELVIDRSGSMLQHGKLDAAKAGAVLYLDTWDDTDEAGLVSFNEDATVDEDLDPLTATHRTDLRNAVNNLVGGGSTSIGDGLLATLPQFDARGDQADNWAVVVLSDGLENSDKRIADFVNTYRARTTAGTKNPRVHTIALGPDADRERLQQLATSTGGTYQFASVSTPMSLSTMSVGGGTASSDAEPQDFGNKMAALFRYISGEVSGEQQVFASTGAVPATETFVVDGLAEELTVALRGDTGGYTVALRDPNGVTHTPTRAETPHAFWRIPHPAAGSWTVDVQCSGTCATEYVADAAVTSSLTMQGLLGLAPEDRLAGRAMPLVVSLSDTGPIAHAQVEVDVVAPDGARTTLPLADDGAHGDGEANDGYYGALYTPTLLANEYVAVVRAEGTSAFGDFTRRARLSWEMTDGPDTDGDTLPDWWETEHGSDVNADDAAADPDTDDLTNRVEFEAGTTPRDADTDDGGEQDGSDIDPLDAADDRLTAPGAVAYPGVGEVFVKYSTPTGYVAVRVDRASTPQGPFVTVAAAAPVTGLFTDAVPDGVQQCYRVVGLGAAGAVSAPADVTCATPSLDPVAPTGYVVIEDGADVTFDTQVELDLVAADVHEPAMNNPDSPPAAEGAVPSGVSDMMISNDPAFAGAVWEPYVPVRQWTLEPVDELATVYVKYRDGAGNESQSAHASITVVDLTDCDIVGTEGNDHLVGTDAAEVICALGGNDHVDGGGGMDAIFGGAGNDRLAGDRAGDLLLGEDGNDVLLGGLGDDDLRGGPGNDVLRGEDGDDRLSGDEGNDYLSGGPGADRMDGGPGGDTVHRDDDDHVTAGSGDHVPGCRPQLPC